MEKRDDIVEINLGELFSIILGRAFLIISAGLFFALTGLFVSKFVLHPVFESTTKIYILNKEENQTVTYSDVQISTQLTSDYAELIKSRYVLEEAIQRLNLVDTNYEDLAKVVRVDTPSDTRIVAITAKDEDPLMAMKIANCIREVSSEHITNVMDIDAINVAETANVPTKKASPGVLRWTIVSGFAGTVVVAFFVVLGFLMDDTIKSNDDIERYLGLSTIGLIPLSADDPGKKKSKK
ncbi:MAG: protein-tyrosine kinase [Butyrivibrio sp.]|nr:protein-tyrosine kinase [Butyrivibrio sp.]